MTKHPVQAAGIVAAGIAATATGAVYDQIGLAVAGVATIVVGAIRFHPRWWFWMERRRES